MRIHRTTRVMFAAIAVLVFVGDQLTKSVVEQSIPLHTVFPVIPHFFNLTDTRNPGAAFGLFSDSVSPWRTAVLIAISVLLLAVVIGVIWRSRAMRWEAGVALALIIGGAASNLTDRIRHGRVTDFLDFHFYSFHWFTFNLADSAIVVGAFLLVIHLLASE
ncbi:MAG: signal peptidase II [Terriglobia bacterium]